MSLIDILMALLEGVIAEYNSLKEVVSGLRDTIRDKDREIQLADRRYQIAFERGVRAQRTLVETAQELAKVKDTLADTETACNYYSQTHYSMKSELSILQSQKENAAQAIAAWANAQELISHLQAGHVLAQVELAAKNDEIMALYHDLALAEDAARDVEKRIANWDRGRRASNHQRRLRLRALADQLRRYDHGLDRALGGEWRCVHRDEVKEVLDGLDREWRNI